MGQTTKSPAPVKKSLVRDTHRMAIKHYEKWLKVNPRATKGERVQFFDEAIDLAARIRSKRKNKNDS